MILERLVLENFRQFRGRQQLVFSDLRERNVTIIHAENGFGKTTLLNALLWGLYGADGLTDDFERPDLLIHEGLAHQCRDPHALVTRVEVAFKHDGDRYVLTRELTLAEQRFDPKKARVTLEQMRDGQTFTVDNPQRRIQAIVPLGISNFLFFNGERIDHLAMQRNSAEVTEAIHQMLGLNLLKTTIEDLQQNVRGRLRKELQDENLSDEKRELIAGLERLEVTVAKTKESIAQAGRNQSAIAAAIDVIDASLEANREAHENQTRRKRLEQDREELGAERDGIERKLAKLIAEDGYTLFTDDLVARGRGIMAGLREQNMIPAPVIDSFLQKLLDEKVCICTRHLEPGSPECEAVQRLLSQAPSQDFNNAVSAIDHAVGLLEATSKQTRTQLVELNTQRLESGRRIREVDEELEDIHQRIGGNLNDEVQALEEKRKQLLLDRDASVALVGRLEGQMDKALEDIEATNRQIREIQDQEEGAARAQRRLDAVEECIRILQQILDAETQELRPILNDEIDSHFRKIIDRQYWAELTPSYTLKIRKKVPGREEGEEVAEIDVALSSGQRQVTSLVFIASLLALARRRSEIPTIVKGLSGNVFPLVTDSPFGQLSIFRWGVARWIPDLAPQVVLLVSPKQYDGEVAQALHETGRIGKQYYLAYHGPVMPERAKPEMEIDGRSAKVYFDAVEESTEIMEL